MSTASTKSQGISRRVNSNQSSASRSINAHNVRSKSSASISSSRSKPISINSAYSYALRVAYLAHLVQPRARRMQSISNPSPQRPKRTSTFHDLMSDFSLVKDSKHSKFPHGFISVLEKRLTGVLVQKEKRKEYQDPLVVRTFAAFLNVLKEQSFRKRMDKDRRPEDLVLIFYSNATKELAKGKDSDDDSWKFMVDRHVALFVRLLGLILKDHDWAKERPELANRLAVLEVKLLSQDQDLMQIGDPATTVEVAAALPSNVRDMPLVLQTARIFNISQAQAQRDVDGQKQAWTTKAALQDLKTYQAQLNLGTGRTLSIGDFPNREAYELWKKSEGPELSQMMLSIVQSDPGLAKSPSEGPANGDSSQLTRTLSNNRASRIVDLAEISSLPMMDATNGASDESDVYTFIPADPRSCYRSILSQAWQYDMKHPEGDFNSKVLTKATLDLLQEICARWRIPGFSRAVLLLDVAREKFVNNDIDLDTLDAAFTLAKETPAQDGRKRNSMALPAIIERRKWTVQDHQLMQQLLASLHEGLMRELYDVMMDCYELKPRPIGPVMYVLENHVEADPDYTEDPEAVDRFRSYVFDGLSQSAKDKYRDLVKEEIPPEPQDWQIDHIMHLGQAITKLAQRIQKRYRNNPEIMG